MPRREQLEELLQQDPDDVFLHYALAMAYLSEGDTQTGLDRLQQVLDRDPDYVPAWFQKGQTLARIGEDEAARDVLTHGIEVARRVGDTHAETEMTGFLETL